MRSRTRRQQQMTKWLSACFKKMRERGISKPKWPKGSSSRQSSKLIGMLSKVGFKLGTFVTLMTACSQYQPVISVTTVTSATISVFVKSATKRINHICTRSARARFPKGKVHQPTAMSWSPRHTCVVWCVRWACSTSTNVCTSASIRNVVPVRRKATRHTGAKLAKRLQSMITPELKLKARLAPLSLSQMLTKTKWRMSKSSST